jgi:pSer/pThr/pTyr-binding forkhead associated (FHA) protein
MGRMWILQSPESHPDVLTFRLSPGAVKTIGRATNADLVLDAALVSRVHCRLEANDETLEVVDLDSTNGTYVNGERVFRAHLIPGDRLRVGRVELAVGRTG